MDNIPIKELYIYPIKSCRGIRVKQIELTQSGPKWDRHFMLMNPQNKFITQRTHPMLAKVSCILKKTRLHLKFEDQSVDFEMTDSPTLKTYQAQIWDDSVEVQEQSIKLSQWFTDCLNTPLKLVRISESFQRKVRKDPTKKALIQFPDCQPLLITNIQSLNALNEVLPSPLPMNRFRTNIVINDLPAFQEDQIKTWQSESQIKFSFTRLCSRCIITNTDQITGIRDKTKESALYGLKQIQGKSKLTFGVNVVYHSSGFLREGEELTTNQPNPKLNGSAT